MNIDILWAKIQQGDEASFKILYRMFQPVLNRYAFHLLKDHFLAEETVNDVFIKIWQNRQSLFSEGDSIKNYLYRVTHNLCLDTLKKTKTTKAEMFIVISSKEWMDLFEKHGNYNCFTEKIEMDEILAIINKIVERMSEQRREVFKLKIDEEMSTKEIADQMDLTESTVRSHLQFARKEIIKKLNSIRK